VRYKDLLILKLLEVKKKKSSVNVDLSVRAEVFCIREGYKVYPVTSNNIKYKIVAEKEHLLVEIK